MELGPGGTSYYIFNKRQIFPDTLFKCQNGWNIQEWLEKKKSFLAKYKIFNHTFAEFLKVMCISKNVNPKLILVSLQREQGLVTKRKMPGEEKLKRALGVGCTDSGDNEKWYGFDNQINGAIKTYVKWFKEPIEKISVDYGKRVVTPKNHFTYALYKYTPHISAADLTHRIWRGWWKEDLLNYDRNIHK